ncbi:MAG TPA: DJ-1/PfpI family protein, partial [Gemmatimonadaceae bacterium]|nr:DJ-1/PfpI family protein [Gemmatimonadaceae bacterium]
SVADFDGLILPGGVANPDALRTDERAVQFVRDFMEADKPVAAICHAPWMLCAVPIARAACRSRVRSPPQAFHDRPRQARERGGPTRHRGS